MLEGFVEFLMHNSAIFIYSIEVSIETETFSQEKERNQIKRIPVLIGNTEWIG